MNNVVLDKKAKSGPRINFHLIFNPEIAVDDVETLIKNLKVILATGTRDYVLVDLYGNMNSLKDRSQDIERSGGTKLPDPDTDNDDTSSDDPAPRRRRDRDLDRGR
jgi:hypothetical protein